MAQLLSYECFLLLLKDLNFLLLFHKDWLVQSIFINIDNQVNFSLYCQKYTCLHRNFINLGSTTRVCAQLNSQRYLLASNTSYITVN